MARPIRFGFRTDSGGDYGLGHFVRCRRLAQEAISRGHAVTFWVSRCHNDGLAVLAAEGIPVGHLKTPFAPLLADADIDCLIVDDLHRDCLADIGRFSRSLAGFRSLTRVVLIDGGGRHAVRDRLPKDAFDLALAPYAGETPGPRALVGAAYCVLDREYENLPRRTCAGKAANVLVTCGGTDPFGLTEEVLAALDDMAGGPLDIRVAVGAGFTGAVREGIAPACRRSRHVVALIDAPASLANHMARADVAVATSGLTKYELAACGLPSLLVSIDEDHRDINKAFLAEGTAWDGGVAGQIDRRALARQLNDLIPAPGDGGPGPVAGGRPRLSPNL